MVIKRRRWTTVGAVCLLLLNTAMAKENLVIGGGKSDSAYAAVAQSICDVIYEHEALRENYSCSVVHTSGSLSNIRGLESNHFQLAIVQADMLHHALNGTSHFTYTGANQDIGVLLSLYPEPFTIMVSADSPIENFSDLVDRHINIGAPYGEQRTNAELLMRINGLSAIDFASISEEGDESLALHALCSGKLDAMMSMSGHPLESYKKYMDDCQLKFISLSKEDIENIMLFSPHTFPSEISSRFYNNEEQNAKTFSGMAFLIGHNRLDPYLTQELLVALQSHESILRTSHPAMRRFSVAQTAFTRGMPLHIAAQTYFGKELYD